jgi:alanyl-tRNA synthetase
MLDHAHRHVARTSDIGSFVITEETSIAAGQRRVSAVTGSDARKLVEAIEEQEERLGEIERIADSKARDTALKTFALVRISLDSGLMCWA